MNTENQTTTTKPELTDQAARIAKLRAELPEWKRKELDAARSSPRSRFEQAVEAQRALILEAEKETWDAAQKCESLQRRLHSSFDTFEREFHNERGAAKMAFESAERRLVTLTSETNEAKAALDAAQSSTAVLAAGDQAEANIARARAAWARKDVDRQEAEQAIGPLKLRLQEIGFTAIDDIASTSSRWSTAKRVGHLGFSTMSAVGQVSTVARSMNATITEGLSEVPGFPMYLVDQAQRAIVRDAATARDALVAKANREDEQTRELRRMTTRLAKVDELLLRVAELPAMHQFNGADDEATRLATERGVLLEGITELREHISATSDPADRVLKQFDEETARLTPAEVTLTDLAPDEDDAAPRRRR